MSDTQSKGAIARCTLPGMKELVNAMTQTKGAIEMTTVQGLIGNKVTAEAMSLLVDEETKKFEYVWMPKVRIGGKEYLCRDDSYPHKVIQADTEAEAIRLGLEFRNRIRDKESIHART